MQITIELLGSLGSLTTAGLAYYGCHRHGFGLPYWTESEQDFRDSHRDAALIRRTWRSLALDQHLKHEANPGFFRAMISENKVIKTPKLLSISTDAYGVTAEFKPLRGIGLDEFAKEARHFATEWGMTRVSVEQPGPRVIRVRAVRRDPLLDKRILTEPAELPEDLRYVPIGLDDFGRPVRLMLESSTGVGIYGAPRWGKTSLILGILSALAPRRDVVMILADGKTSTGFEGDYYDIGHRCAAVIGDDIKEYNALIKDIRILRERRQRAIRATLGVPNFWDVGPSEEWPLVLVVIDEAHSYFKQVNGLKEQNAVSAENAWLTEDVVKKCGSVGIEFVIATQKPTTDSIPSAIRDCLTHRLCLGVHTNAVAVAALGEGIKDDPDANPTQFMRTDFRGCASMASEDTPGFTRFRSPFCPPQLTAAISRDTKHLVSLGLDLPFTVGRAHLPELPDAPAALLRPDENPEN